MSSFAVPWIEHGFGFVCFFYLVYKGLVRIFSMVLQPSRASGVKNNAILKDEEDLTIGKTANSVSFCVCSLET